MDNFDYGVEPDMLNVIDEQDYATFSPNQTKWNFTEKNSEDKHHQPNPKPD